MKWFGKVGRTLRTLHRDEQGADLVEYILIVAAIALPLLGVIIMYKGRIEEWLQEQWDEIRGE